METLLQRAKSFASDAAKRSQDLAKEAAKISQDIALETAKRSKEIASEASKKADQLKTLAGEIIPSTNIVSSSSSTSSSSVLPSDGELRKYGITTELREFVRDLTISTFQDFPADGFDGDRKDEVSTSNVRKDLTEWQEKHALLVLKSVPEISKFRYELCPKVMKESRFWKIYFTLVRSHIVLYEAPTIIPDEIIGIQLSERAVLHEVKVKPDEAKVSDAAEKKRAIDDKDLDAYLLGEIDSDGGDGVEDAGFDEEFDQLVNISALDSDAEAEEERSDAKKTDPLSV